MSTREYAALSYQEKRELLRMNGSFLAEHCNNKEGKKTIYALYGFYVELNCDTSDQERYIRVYDSYYHTETQLDRILINLN